VVIIKGATAASVFLQILYGLQITMCIGGTWR